MNCTTWPLAPATCTLPTTIVPGGRGAGIGTIWLPPGGSTAPGNVAKGSACTSGSDQLRFCRSMGCGVTAQRTATTVIGLAVGLVRPICTPPPGCGFHCQPGTGTGWPTGAPFSVQVTVIDTMGLSEQKPVCTAPPGGIVTPL